MKSRHGWQPQLSLHWPTGSVSEECGTAQLEHKHGHLRGQRKVKLPKRPRGFHIWHIFIFNTQTQKWCEMCSFKFHSFNRLVFFRTLVGPKTFQMFWGTVQVFWLSYFLRSDNFFKVIFAQTLIFFPYFPNNACYKKEICSNQTTMGVCGAKNKTCVIYNFFLKVKDIMTLYPIGLKFQKHWGEKSISWVSARF